VNLSIIPFGRELRYAPVHPDLHVLTQRYTSLSNLIAALTDFPFSHLTHFISL
jgi:hypothetical protein